MCRLGPSGGWALCRRRNGIHYRCYRRVCNTRSAIPSGAKLRARRVHAGARPLFQLSPPSRLLGHWLAPGHLISATGLYFAPRLVPALAGMIVGQHLLRVTASRDISALVLFRIGNSWGALGHRSSLVSSGRRTTELRRSERSRFPGVSLCNPSSEAKIATFEVSLPCLTVASGT